MANTERQHRMAQIPGTPGEKPSTTQALWKEYFRTEMQPTTTMMLVAILMILYARVTAC